MHSRALDLVAFQGVGCLELDYARLSIRVEKQGPCFKTLIDHK